MESKKMIIFTTNENDAETVRKFTANRFGLIIDVRIIATRFTLWLDTTDRDEQNIATIKGYAMGVYDAIRGQIY